MTLYGPFVTSTGAQTVADAAVGTHKDDTTDVHGIPNTALLETLGGAQAKADAAQAAAEDASASALDTHAAATTGAHGATGGATLVNTASTGTAAINARVAVSKAGSLVGTRRKVNFIEGSNVTLTIADDSANEEVDVTIASTGGGGGTVTGLATLSGTAAIASLSPTTGDVYWVAGIRGGNQFIVEASGTADNVFTFATANGKIMRRQWDGKEIRVTWGGAVPSATYAGMTDQSAAINAVINAIPSPLSGATIYFPVDPIAGVGWYGCANPIEVFYNADSITQVQKRGGLLLKGPGGIGHGQNNIPPSRLVYTGTGDRFIDARSSNTRLESLAVLYNNSDCRLVLDGRITVGSRTVTSEAANFVVGDVGKGITGLGIPVGSRIAEVVSENTIKITSPRSYLRGRTFDDAEVVSANTTITSATANFTSADLGRSVTDGITNNSTTLTSATANFTSADLYSQVTATTIPAGTIIARVVNSSTVTLSAQASSGTSLSLTITPVLRGTLFGGGTTIVSVTSATEAVISEVPAKASGAMRNRGRTVTDGVINTGTPTILTSATAAFTEADYGLSVEAIGIPSPDGLSANRTYIQSVDSSIQVTLSQNVTASATGVTVKIAEVPMAIGGFQGSLIDFKWYPNTEKLTSSGDSNQGWVHRCLLGAYRDSGARYCTADALVDFGNTVDVGVTESKLIGARHGIRGCGGVQEWGMGVAYFANGVTVKSNEFSYCWGGAITTPAQAWGIHTNIFEGLRSEGSYATVGYRGTDRIVYTDLVTGEAALSQCRGLSYLSNWHGDSGGSNFPEIWLDNGPQQWQGIQISGNSVGNSSADVAIRLEGAVDGMFISGNQFECRIAMLVVSNSSRKEGVWFVGNGVSGCTSTVVGPNKYGIYVFGNRDKTQGTDPPGEWWGGFGDARAAGTHPAGVPLLGFKNAAGTRMMAFDSSGRMQFVDSTLSTATATAGAATLPANPVGFFTMLDSSGTVRKVPYYAI